MNRSLIYQTLVPVLLTLLVTGCASGLGPNAIQRERPDYNRQIVRSTDEQMLLNLVRLRYNDTPLFLELGSVVASYGYNAAFNASGSFASTRDNNGVTLGTGLGYYEHPTVTYSPLTGDQFAERLLSPIPLDSLMLFSQSGWTTERLLLVAALRVNNLYNAPTATGPTPERKPDFERFLEFTKRFRSVRLADLTGMNWERKAGETNAVNRNPQFWIHTPADTNSTIAADVLAVRRALDLEAGRTDFTLTAFPFNRQPNELGIRCRSLMGVLYFLSTAVEPPPPHAQAGLVTVTKDEHGQPFDWVRLTGQVLTIHSQKDRPKGAAVAVPHRDWWFYIADNDQNSKITFSLLHTLFQLQASTASGRTPLLTLPAN